MATSKMSDAKYYRRLGGAECVSVMYDGNMASTVEDSCKMLEEVILSDRSLLVVKPVRSILS